ncbi:MAG: fumarylacetoacetate hydrolase family protein [Rhodococcus sp. (in: high G+C Gram-positive bacteria)]|jgi:2-keto-4-pentenoate hydratase/2-oxohepta-3-ene-1,7-dioic acid hydratase in catechol pathway|uniref:fumarylacetoacetate hydrolase family protein n=1 Tax=Rhodococcus sp. EPR-157 TaxID=1813677 RepID=UPI0007BBDF98|nr:fumarylacetoacetate hydrolase family protein [Rhodococcus sp. EPR-157]KZF12557.1 fumarylacetoacetate hydrolase [Rhodococcus sp. EPR-157]
MSSRIVGVQFPDGHVDVGRLSESGDAVATICELSSFWAAPREALLKQPERDVPVADVRLVPPVLPSARVICIGLNYADHVAEGSFRDDDLPPYPTLFARWTSSLTVGGTEIPVPADEQGLDWEGEVVAWVGQSLVDATPEDASKAVIGYSVFNDITARRAQKLTSQWILGKNADRSGPLGPLVPAEDVGDLRDGLRIETRVNGTTVQSSNTDRMIYSIGETLSHISRTFTLNPGDLLATGTPSGVGYARTPPWLMVPGDVVEVEVERLGKVANTIVGPQFRTR